MAKSPKRSQDRLAYGIAEFAKAVGWHRTTVWRQIAKGHIKTVRVGDREMIPVDEVRRLKLLT